MEKSSNCDMLVPIGILLLFLHKSLCVDLIYHMEEEKSPGTYIGNIATDSYLLDSVSYHSHTLITFNQLKQNMMGSLQLFNVSKRGKLYTAQTLDAESLCTYNIECFKSIKIAVHKAEAFMKILKVKVIIEDVNDHQPKFPFREVNIDFSETDAKGTTKPIPNAIDKDFSLLNSLITYKLREKINQPFILLITKRITGSSKLRIILDGKLDREVRDTYNLQIIAKDGGSPTKQSVLDVQISVRDENDNPPTFTQNIYNISIKNTHQCDIPVVIVSAQDLDSGKNGRITYQFSLETSDTAENYFKVNKTSGEIFVQKNVTSGQEQTYKLFVEAKDDGNPPLSSLAIVLVNVINQQNNVPKIDINFVSEYTKNTIAISEKIKVDSFIAYVSVIDNDIGQNGEVKCYLHHDKFLLLNIGSNEYKITLTKSVDREIQDHYDISITCQDKGFPPLQSERKISIQVTDVNDVQPQFTQHSFKFLTYENRKTHFPIGFVNVTDPDLGLGGQLTFSLMSKGKYVIPFQITDYGFISTTIPLDREQQEIYKFQVLVKDNGTPSLNNTANVIVEILDKNDNAPYFTFPSVNPFSLDVHYSPQSKKDIAVLRASDRDTHLNAFLRYEILKGNTKHLFTVNPHSGALFFSRKVYQNDAGTYDLQLVVKDSGTPVLSATTTLSLTLTVSNITAKMFTAVDSESDNRVHINLMIIIVVAAVIVSVVIVVSITLCVVRSNNGKNVSHNAGVNTPVQLPREKTYLTSQSRKSVHTTRHSSETRNRNTQLMEPRHEFYPQYESQSEWTTPTMEKRPRSVLLLPTRIRK